MKNFSIWSEEIKNKFSKLEKDKDIDVLIIGGGITGISTAYHLINSNLNVCLVEKNIIGSGVTSKTTGKLTYLQENIYSKLNTYHGYDKTKLYLESQKYAINLVKDIINKEHIDCNLEKVKSYTFTDKDSKKYIKEKNISKKLNINYEETDTLPNNEKVYNSFYVDDTFVFHPIKYINSLANICNKNNIEIYENTLVLSIVKEKDYYVCKTQNNIIKTKYIVFALHYPYFLIPFETPLKTHIEKSYIEAFEVDKNYKYSAISISKPTILTRFYSNKDNNYQIYLSNSHNSCIHDNDLKNFYTLIKQKDNEPEYLWSNKDIITNDYFPFIGPLKDNDNSMLIGTGYNTWGMTNGSLAGKILSDIILNKENKYKDLFKPTRSINIGKAINFPIILGSNILSFSKSKVYKQKSWYSNNVRFEKRNGKNIAIYTDEKKREHIVYNLCPHLKCSLIFNEIERTWDCPCHGSRFDLDGHSIEGPSNYDISYKE